MRTHSMDNQLIEYIKLNRLSMSQDLDLIESHEVTNEGYPKEYLQGAIACMDHILEYANEL